ncbi:MAG: class I SAM-dependent methyltransferase [Burkholderiales bacterium]
MNLHRTARQLLIAALFATSGTVVTAQDKPFEPYSGQPGKDVVWVPTPATTVSKMLEVAKVTPQDLVMDLGSGDGRNIIAAAKLGARAVGVEYNPDMVKLSESVAVKEGVADKAKFVQGDMFTADISQATVMALFLLPDNLRKLNQKFLDLRPGTRIVVNTFGIDGWEAAHTESAQGDCGAWCSVILYIVPAKVAGTWKMAQGELKIEQKVQTISGTLTTGGVAKKIDLGRVTGEQVSFSVDGVEYSGRLMGDSLSGSVKNIVPGTWAAVRTQP